MNFLSPFLKTRAARIWSGLGVALIIAATASAQQVIAPPPQQPLVAPVMRETIQDQSSIATESIDNTLGPVFAVGAFQLHPRLFASFVHADGLPAGTTRVTSDISTFAPGLLVDLGQHWTIDYTATAHNYSAKELNNAVDQDFRLVGANRSPDWTLQFADGYSVSSPILIETARQTKQKTWSNQFSVDHQFGNQLSYQGSFSMMDTKSANLPETRDWGTEQWARTKLSSRTDAGIGLGLGYSDIVAQPNTHFERYLGDITWRPTDRINVSLQGGWEDWHSLSAAIGSTRNPILSASLGWQPFDPTRVTLTDSRAVTNTLTGDGVTKSNGWGASLNQRLLGKLFLRLGYNDDSSDYTTGTGSTLNGRTDRVKSFNGALSILVYKYWVLAATYQTSKNDSNQAGYTYSSSQYGLELSGRF